MKRKPDLLWMLVILFGLGVVTTGYAQSLWSNSSDAPIELAQQQVQPFKRYTLIEGMSVGNVPLPVRDRAL